VLVCWEIVARRSALVIALVLQDDRIVIEKSDDLTH
jgi:hypothetical protein